MIQQIEKAKLVLLVSVHLGGYPGYSEPILGGNINIVWKGEASLRGNFIWIDAIYIDNPQKFVGKYLVVFIIDKFSQEEPGRILRILEPSENNIFEATVNIIRQLDEISGFPRRGRDDFPHNFPEEIIDFSEGVLIPVKCSKSQRLFYIRMVKERHFYRPIKESIIENTQRLPIISELNGEKDFSSIIRYAYSHGYHPPVCTFCNWSDYRTCPKCNMLHCSPRDGQTLAGNGVIFKKPDQFQTITISCPSCGFIRSYVHSYYRKLNDSEHNIYFDGDAP